MRELPITFNDEMVCTIIDGDKTVTRRPVKSPAKSMQRAGMQVIKRREPGDAWYGDCVWSMRDRMGVWGDYTEEQFLSLCPYGEPGDVLYVRECVAYLDDAASEALGRGLVYRADADLVRDDSGDRTGWWLGDVFFGGKARPFKWTPSILAPKQMSRIFLRVTSVRVERVQDITEEQARAEGVYPICGGYMADVDSEWRTTAREAFRDLWDGLSKPGARWADNPWVWVIEFERMEVKR